MSFLYKVIASGFYFAVWPYGRIRAGMGNKFWQGRIGLIRELVKCDIWVHAASVGEAKIAGYLINYLLKHKLDIQIYFTTMTSSGQKTANQITSDNVIVGSFPFDRLPIIQKILKQVQPKMLIIVETEIWPNLIEQTNALNIPILLVNARMSDRAYKKYKCVTGTMKKLLSYYDRFFVKTESDKLKFRSFAVDDSKMNVSGDMKFDAPLLPRSAGRRSEIRSRLGVKDNDFVFVAGSTRHGEEKLLLQLVKRFAEKYKNSKIVIAPRHLRRLKKIKRELLNRNIDFGRYGDHNTTAPVILVEQMGVLNDLYLAADLSFVGGTLVNIGGHNILEPVWAGCPVLFGPFTSNVDEAKEYILKHNYGRSAADILELIDVTIKFINKEVSFQIKQDIDLEHSPTAVAGDYIIERLTNA